MKQRIIRHVLSWALTLSMLLMLPTAVFAEELLSADESTFSDVVNKSVSLAEETSTESDTHSASMEAAIQADEAETEEDIHLLVSDFAGGSGTEEDPYLIATKEHLDNVRNHLSAHYKMVDDIVFTEEDFAKEGAFYNNGHGWAPIENYDSSYDTLPFEGSFDGGNHTITGLKQNNRQYGGLFGEISGATIQNLGMVDTDISNTSFIHMQAGSITGHMEAGSTINNCYNTGTVTSAGNAGGIVGFMGDGCTVSNCYNTGSVTSNAAAGGIAGHVYSCDYTTMINACYNTGNIDVVKASSLVFAGGIAGSVLNKLATVSNCYNIGMVSADSTSSGSAYVGGIAGERFSSTFSSCYYLDTASCGIGLTNGMGSVGTTACAVEEMKLSSTFAGFDFVNTWTMVGNADYFYPELQEVEMVFTKSVLSMSISTLPNKVSYLESRDTLDLTGGTMLVHYDNGTSERIALTPAMISGFDNTAVGKQTLTVTYGSQTASFDIEIIAKVPVSIAVTTQPIKICYLEAKDTLDTAGGKITIYYNNDTSEEIPLTNDMVSGFSPSVIGRQTLIVTYDGKTTTYEVEVIAKTVSSIAVTTLPFKTSYLETTPLDTTGGKLTIYYNNDTSDEVDLTVDMVSGFDAAVPGEQTVIVTYAGKTTTFLVTVTAKLISSIVLSTLPNKLSYVENDPFDVTGGKITIYYANGTQKTIALTMDMVSGFNSTLIGEQTLTVSYEYETTTFDVCIGSDEFSGGLGTTKWPYLISNKKQLNGVRNHLGAHFKLTTDIVFNNKDFTPDGLYYNDGTGWAPIGSKETPFTGSFDGNGHTISGLKQAIAGRENSHTYAGLLGYIQNAVIKNLGMLNSDIYVTQSTSSNFYRAYAGSIAGYVTTSSTIKNCYSTGSVRSNSYSGGISGYTYHSTISACYNVANVTGRWGGGISGGIGTKGLRMDVINNCFNLGSITYSSAGGGIVGTGYAYSNIKNCYNVGRAFAGIIGSIPEGCVHLIDCYYLDSSSMGIGSIYGGDIKDGSVMCTKSEMETQNTFQNFSFGDIWEMGNSPTYPMPVLKNVPLIPDNIDEFAGGFGTAFCPYLINSKEHLLNVEKYPSSHFRMIADIIFTEDDFSLGGEFYNSGAGWISLCASDNAPFSGTFDGDGHIIKGLRQDMNVTDTTYTGLFACSENATIKNLGILDIQVRVLGISASIYSGGILGYAGEDTTISNCYSTGVIDISSFASSYYTAYAGGIVGYSTYATIEKCWNSTEIYSYGGSAYAYGGGIVGYSNIGDIRYCYNLGKVESQYAGGIAGYAYSPIFDCYNVGTIRVEHYLCAGGIAGYIQGYMIRNCYNLGTVTAGDFDDAYAGGIVGQAGNPQKNLNDYCYYLNNISTGVGNSPSGGTACTLEELRAEGCFEGFNFSNIWTMEGNPEYPYPELIGLEMNATTILTAKQTSSGIQIELALVGNQLPEDLYLVAAFYDSHGKQTHIEFYTAENLIPMMLPGGLEISLENDSQCALYLLDTVYKPQIEGICFKKK